MVRTPDASLGAGSVFAHGPQLTKFTEQLPIPPVLNAAGGGSFELPMAPGVHSFHADLPPATTWGYGGAGYLGPTFEARRGVPFEVMRPVSRATRCKPWQGGPPRTTWALGTNSSSSQS